MKTFNLNEYIKVKPNPDGIELIKKRGLGYGVKYEPDSDGYCEMQGWAFVAVFGPSTTWGNNYLEMNILINDKDLK